MQRQALVYLHEWLTNTRRKPLVMRGARQVGKTWLARQLAKEAGKKLLELNFEQQPALRGLFDTNDPVKILRNLEGVLDYRIQIDESILCLDEIQAFPEVLSKLRWFYESLPALPVIAAGSLLDFALAEHEFSMPVGRISYLHVEPLSFEEFLLAKGSEPLVSLLQAYQLNETIPDAIHIKLMDAFREYVIVGGMPDAVASWIENNSLKEIARVHGELLLTYRDDFSKYSGRLSARYLDMVMAAIPRLLGQKFVFSHVDREVKSATLKKALDLLCKARLCYRIQATTANGVPLLSEVNEKHFKVGFLDIGLVSSALDLKLEQLETTKDLNLVNQGALSEQVVGQLLRCMAPLHAEPQSYYWCREVKNANAEIDYLIQYANDIIPIEVKSGKTGSLKSLQQFMQLKKRQCAVRINADFPSIADVSVRSHTGELATYQLLSLPFYLVMQLERLLSDLT